MMEDKRVNKYMELISKVEYDDRESEKIFEAITKKFEGDNNVQIVKDDSKNITPVVKTDKCDKKYSFILRLAAVLVLFAVVLIPIIPETRSMIKELYNRLYQIQETATPHITPTQTITPTPSVTPTASPTKTPSPTKQQTPEPTVYKYVFDTEETRSFTEEEEILNKVYHAMFPERTDYIAYWAGDNIFWAPANLEPNMPYGYYPERYMMEYKYVSLPDENSKILLLEEVVLDAMHYRDMYCVRFDSDTGEVLSKRFKTYYVENALSYVVFNCRGETYLAFSRNTWTQGELYFGEIVACDTMEQVWSIQDLYPDNWDSYKVELTEEGINFYCGERKSTRLKNIEFDKFIPYDELI